MASRKANEAHFYFICADLKEKTFEVADFTGMENLSTPYEFTITLISHESDVDPDMVVGKPATLFIHRSGEYVPFSGIVNEFQLVDYNTDYYTYSATLVPQFWLTSMNKQTKIFQNMDVVAIIKEVLDGSGINNYEVDAKTYTQQEFVVQYQESDLQFITRLMEHVGLWYFFVEPALLPEEVGAGASQEKLVITDKPSRFTDINGEATIIYRSVSGLHERIEVENKESISQLRFEKRVIPSDVFVKNYNYRKPEVELTGKQMIKEGLAGTVYEFGGDFKEPNDAQLVAKVLANRIVAQQSRVRGVTNCRGFRVGHRFVLSEYFREDYNSTYVITQVSHTGGHLAGGNGEVTYENSFQLITSQKAENYAPVKKTPIPKVNGVLTAMIEANGGDYAHIDETGRYKVKMPYDLSGSKNDCKNSKYIRLAQPYSGPQYGMHFPSHEGVEMVLACIDGDPNRPVGIGTVPHANTISPVVDQNKFQNIIRTAGGNELLMHDEDGKQKIRLITNAKHTLLMDDETRAVSLTSTDKNALVLDDQNTKVTLNSGKHTISMSYEDGNECIVVATAAGHIVKLDDANERITIQSKGGHYFDMDDSSNKIVIADKSKKSKVTFDGAGGLLLESQGKIEIKAQQDLTISAANIKINAQAKMDVKAGADLNLAGMNVAVKADMNTKVDAGMTLALKGGVKSSLEGTMVEVKGSGITSIAGTLVKIN